MGPMHGRINKDNHNEPNSLPEKEREEYGEEGRKNRKREGCAWTLWEEVTRDQYPSSTGRDARVTNEGRAGRNRVPIVPHVSRALFARVPLSLAIVNHH